MKDDPDQPSNVIPFVFEDHLVRAFTIDGEPWFVLADLCAVLNLSNPSKVAADLDPDEVMTLTNSEGHSGQRGGAQSYNIVSESGLYALVFKSRKPEAKRFRKWVTAEVLPTIRRTGRYEAAEPHAFAFTEEEPLQALSLKLQLVKEARLTHGVPAGRRIWKAVGLPFVPVAPADDDHVAEGVECLDYLLDAETPRGPTLRAVIAQALNGSVGAREALAGLGVLIDEARDGLIFANTARFLRETAARAKIDHVAALRNIPGATPWKKQRFAGLQSRATFLPMGEFEPLLKLWPDVEAEAAAA